MRIVICWPSTSRSGWPADRRLHLDRGVDRGVAVVKVAMISSPMVLTTEPPCCSVARRMISMQTETLSRAATSPRTSRTAACCRRRPQKGSRVPVPGPYGVPRPPVDYIIRIIGRKLAGRPNRGADMLDACSAGRRTMALSVEISTAGYLRHVVARSHGRRLLYADAGSRAKAARRIAECLRPASPAMRGLVRDGPFPASRRARIAGKDHARDRRARAARACATATASRRR